MIEPGQSELTSLLVILLEPRFQGPLSSILNVAREDRDMKGLGNEVDSFRLRPPACSDSLLFDWLI